VQRIVAEHCEEARTAVLYAKPHSIVNPDFVWKRTAQWITFPWSAEPPVTA
jgi:hypoxanthine phosphoribosyltransferase